ncbi:Phosphatidylinositol transfer protein PDR16 [Madurella mycetomatis]|uniref:Phosphatidylinositol transfer protein PDR16 n=1 Tax=Madurella mycetomatis TaxID=100816 RepID=A0A175VYE8_9PEZI|nr:Phosphatidylinositol transfer protein PDR16 [Madurella mycetomatis]KXX78977.1 Phosphatidylinositol transfer protein PDR16 [Madurella mycetomatis]
MGSAGVAPQPGSAAHSVHEKASGPLKLPLAFPTPESRPKERPALAVEQQQKYDWLLQQAKAWTEVPSSKGKAGPLTDSERFWLTKECLLRYLRATKWQEKEAEKRLLETLTWRREYGVEELTADHISPENETGKQIILGYDKEARVCHYLNPGRQNTEPSPRQVQHLVYMVERVIDIMPPGQETLALLINFKQSKSRSNTAPGLGQAREVLHILQYHYPERLGRALIINMPWIVTGFFKLITPFIDPNTREKLKFNEDMSQYVPIEQMWTEFNGKLEFDYDHSTYWPALHKLCGERREARWQRWVAGGQQLGESEDYLAGTAESGVAASRAAEVEVKTEKDIDSAAAGPAPAAEQTAQANTAGETAETKVEAVAASNGSASH